MLHNLLKPTNNRNNTSVKVYCCGNDKVFKIGQTTQKYLCQRLQTIRKIDEGIEGYCFVEFEGSKALLDYIESVVRLYLYNKGYTLQGNDHFKRKYTTDRFIRLFLEAVTTALNELQIDYTVHHLKA